MEVFAITGYRTVRAVGVSFAFVCKDQISEVIVFDAVLVFAQLGSEWEESGVDRLEVLGECDSVVLAVADSVLAVAEADAGQKLVAGHRSDQSQIPVAVESDMAVVE